MIFCPSCVTNQTGPTFSVISMRPSGRNASRHGKVKVVTVVIVKGRLVSGFCSPALNWAQAAADARISSNAAFANFIVVSPCFSSARSYAIPIAVANRNEVGQFEFWRRSRPSPLDKTARKKWRITCSFERMTRKKRNWLIGIGLSAGVGIAALFVAAYMLANRFEPYIRQQA